MTSWLTEDQQESWRSWIAANSLLNDKLSRELQSAHGLTMADYEILVRLSEAPERRMRMSVLAQRALSSRSRLSHQIDRMASAGLVTREACPADGRGQNAVLTDHGWTTLQSASHTHVTGVRQHLVDLFSDREFAALGKASAKIAEHLEPGYCPSILGVPSESVPAS